MELVQVIEWLGAQPTWLGMGLLGVSALIEYLFPPFPGDVLAISGAVMVGAQGWPWWGVLLALLFGSVVGGWIDWRVGVWLEETERETWLHRFLKEPDRAEKLEKVKKKFETHGAWFIVVNRFVPAFRSLFFVASGMAGLPAWKVVLFGSISALLWNALLMGVGVLVGFNVDRLSTLMSRYGQVFWGLMALLVIGWLVARVRKMVIAKRSNA